MGCSSCPTDNCTCPINCNGPQCPKDQLVCYNQCFNYNIDGRGPRVISMLRGVNAQNLDMSICITNEGPATVTVNFLQSIGVVIPGSNVDIPPQSGALIVAQNVNGAQLFILGGNVDDTARGQVKFEAQEKMKVNC